MRLPDQNFPFVPLYVSFQSTQRLRPERREVLKQRHEHLVGSILWYRRVLHSSDLLRTRLKLLLSTHCPISLISSHQSTFHRLTVSVEGSKARFLQRALGLPRRLPLVGPARNTSPQGGSEASRATSAGSSRDGGAAVDQENKISDTSGWANPYGPSEELSPPHLTYFSSVSSKIFLVVTFIPPAATFFCFGNPNHGNVYIAPCPRGHSTYRGVH